MEVLGSIKGMGPWQWSLIRVRLPRIVDIPLQQDDRNSVH